MPDSVVTKFVNLELPTLIERGEVSQEQAFEAIGIMGLVHGILHPTEQGDPLFARAADKIFAAIVASNDSQSPSHQRSAVLAFVKQAFRVNPALVALKRFIQAHSGTSPETVAAFRQLLLDGWDE
jgi:hypothetical protein